MTAAALRAWRLGHRWSVPQAAHLLRVTPGAVYHWERGRRPVPPGVESQCLTLDNPAVVQQVVARYGPLPQASRGPAPKGLKNIAK